MSPTKRARQPHQADDSEATFACARALPACLGAILLAGCAASHSHSHSHRTSTSTSTGTATAANSTSTPSDTGSPLPPGVIARVGGYTITKPVLGQWMTETLASDFYAITAGRVPLGLVAEPANYPACLAELDRLAPSPGQRPPRPTTPQLLTKCHQLYTTIKNQSLEYLVASYWSKNYDTAHAIHITPTETHQELKHIQTTTSPGTYRQMLTDNRRTPTQETFIIETQLLDHKVANKLLHAGEHALTQFNEEAEHTENNASCRLGYIVAHCRGYQPTHTIPPNQLLQEIAHWHLQTARTALPAHP